MQAQTYLYNSTAIAAGYVSLLEGLNTKRALILAFQNATQLEDNIADVYLQCTSITRDQDGNEYLPRLHDNTDVRVHVMFIFLDYYKTLEQQIDD